MAQWHRVDELAPGHWQVQVRQGGSVVDVRINGDEAAAMAAADYLQYALPEIILRAKAANSRDRDEGL